MGMGSYVTTNLKRFLDSIYQGRNCRRSTHRVFWIPREAVDVLGILDFCNVGSYSTSTNAKRLGKGYSRGLDEAKSGVCRLHRPMAEQALVARGWQGKCTPDALKRKTQSIRCEHELSRILVQEQAITPIQWVRVQLYCTESLGWWTVFWPVTRPFEETGMDSLNPAMEEKEPPKFLAKVVEPVQKLLAPLIFLPNVMPLKFLFSTEIFPWAFLYGFRKNLVFNKRFIVWVAYLFLGLIIWAPPVKNFGFRSGLWWRSWMHASCIGGLFVAMIVNWGVLIPLFNGFLVWP